MIDTLLRRDYVWKKGSALVPTWTAFAKQQLLERFFAHLIDYEFTAGMEEALDAIARLKASREVAPRLLVQEQPDQAPRPRQRRPPRDVDRPGQRRPDRLGQPGARDHRSRLEQRRQRRAPVRTPPGPRRSPARRADHRERPTTCSRRAPQDRSARHRADTTLPVLALTGQYRPFDAGSADGRDSSKNKPKRASSSPTCRSTPSPSTRRIGCSPFPAPSAKSPTDVKRIATLNSPPTSRLWGPMATSLETEAWACSPSPSGEAEVLFALTQTARMTPEPSSSLEQSALDSGAKCRSSTTSSGPASPTAGSAPPSPRRRPRLHRPRPGCQVR